MKINYQIQLNELTSALECLEGEHDVLKGLFNDWQPAYIFEHFVLFDFLLERRGVLYYYERLKKMDVERKHLKNENHENATYSDRSELKLKTALDQIVKLYFRKYEQVADAICPKCHTTIKASGDIFFRHPEYNCSRCDYFEIEDYYIGYKV